MHDPEEVAAALRLGDAGLSATEISRRTGIARRTVSDWLHDRVPRGWSSDRDYCARCGQEQHQPDRLPDSYVYLLGAYLGDGCLSPHPRAVFKLRVVLDAKYPGIIDEVAAAAAAVCPLNPVGRVTRYGTSAEGDAYPSCVEVYAYSRSWPCLFPQHGPGRKHDRPIVLTDWQHDLVARAPTLLLRGLIHSDGCRFRNTGSHGWSNPRYSFSNVSDDIRGIFVAACERLGLHTTSAPRTVYVSRKTDVARMDEFVGPKA
jgi:hypothetical protein